MDSAGVEPWHLLCTNGETLEQRMELNLLTETEKIKFTWTATESSL
jgi:hypothetical protein